MCVCVCVVCGVNHFTNSCGNCPLFTISIIGGRTFPLKFLRGGGLHSDPPSNILNSSVFQVSGESPYWKESKNLNFSILQAHVTIQVKDNDCKCFTSKQY